MTDESKISQRYRELPRDEPPRHVDEAILAAARRAARTRPAPLVVPSGRQRWYFPLAAAAIIVLAVAVTVHVERQNRDVELAEAPVAIPPPPPVAREEQAAPAQAPAAPPAAAPPPKPGAKRELYAPDPKPAPSQERSAATADSRELRAQRDAESLTDLQKTQQAPALPPPPAAAEAPARQDAVGAMRESPQPKAVLRSRADVASGAVSGFATASPEQWLQGIADLRRQGRHEEADKALAEFRKRYPAYRISEAMLEKVEKRQLKEK